ncbi:MAG: dipeptide ABC transporter ATP-binding protein [Clostridia bacterium]
MNIEEQQTKQNQDEVKAKTEQNQDEEQIEIEQSQGEQQTETEQSQDEEQIEIEQDSCDKDVILEIKDLVVQFNLRGRTLTAVRGSSLKLYRSETLAIVGESGSGKSVLTKTFVGMTDKNGWVESGNILFDGQDLAEWSTRRPDYNQRRINKKNWLKIRGKRIAMVFQDPMTALNPLKRIGEQIKEVLVLHSKLNKEDAKKEAMSLMEKVGIPDVATRYYQYPHEFSGGMRQRIVIATAIACHPDILICDEPTTALDVTLQTQILKLLKDIQAELDLTVVFITHDLGVVANVADRVAVMYAGEIVEIGSSDELFSLPVHPYTRALMKSLPQLGVKGEDLYAIKGTPPNLYKEIKGDAFAYRNPDALKIDFEQEPPFFEVSPTHKAKTWTLHKYAIDKYGDPKNYIGSASSARSHFAKAVVDRNKLDELNKKEVILSVENLCVDFGAGKKKFRAVDNASFQIHKGETFALVGESGSGKTTIGRSIMKITPNSSGQIVFNGERIDEKLNYEQMKQFRQSVQMIFQDPMASLNERAKVDYIISEGLYNFKLFKNEEERKEKVAKAMIDVGLSPEFASRFPHEFSGGQRQRLGIARALIMQPQLIIADEPISALDVSIRAQIINLLNYLKKARDLTYLFIAHDLSVVRFISDRIAVIHKGKIVELAEAEELFLNPMHPYTKALLSAIPMPDPEYERNKIVTNYDPKVSHDYSVQQPSWQKLKEGHFILANDKEMEIYIKNLQPDVPKVVKTAKKTAPKKSKKTV